MFTRHLHLELQGSLAGAAHLAIGLIDRVDHIGGTGVELGLGLATHVIGQVVAQDVDRRDEPPGRCRFSAAAGAWA